AVLLNQPKEALLFLEVCSDGVREEGDAISSEARARRKDQEEMRPTKHTVTFRISPLKGCYEVRFKESWATPIVTNDGWHGGNIRNRVGTDLFATIASAIEAVSGKMKEFDRKGREQPPQKENGGDSRRPSAHRALWSK